MRGKFLKFSGLMILPFVLGFLANATYDFAKTKIKAKIYPTSLEYYDEELTTLKINSSTVHVLNVLIINSGIDVAENIRVHITLHSNAEIHDIVVSTSSIPIQQYDLHSETKRNHRILVGSLVPKEKMKITIVFSGPSEFKPKVHVKSDKTIGKRIQKYTLENGK